MKNFHPHPGNLITKDNAEPILQPHLATIQASCTEGLAAWLSFAESMADLRAPLTARTMACFVNDWVVQKARIKFDGVPGVTIHEEPGDTFTFGIDQRLLLRFKKLNDEDQTCNIYTGRQTDINCQLLYFPGWESVTVVSAGYHFTPTGDGIDRIIITCVYLDYTLWFIPVLDSESEGGALLPFPEPTQPTPRERVRQSRVIPKNLKKPEGHE